MSYRIENRNAFCFGFAVAFFILLGSVSFPAFADEHRTLVWQNDAGTLQQLEQTCRTCGILSGDVFWVNGYTTETLPPEGEILLIPESKSAIVPTWMEAQSRKNGASEPMVSVRLHGVPAALRGTSTSSDVSAHQDTPSMAASPLSEDLAGKSSVIPVDAASVRPASGDGGTTKKRLPVAEDEPLVTVKLHGRPAFLTSGDEKVFPDPQTPSPAEVLSVAVPSSDVTSTDFRLVSHNLSSEDIGKEVAPVVSASPDLSATTATRKEPIKNMKLIVSGDELIITSPSGSKVMREETPPSHLANLPPLVLTPPSQPPLAPTKTDFVAPGKMMWPVSGKVSSGFGKRGKRHFHSGLDLPMPKGTPIQAAMDGVVLETCTTKDKRYRGYGNAVLIEHANGLVTMYAHCQKVTVKPGQKVRQGETVGLVGNTGRTTTWHVHFEVRKNGKPLDPMPYMAKRI